MKSADTYENDGKNRSEINFKPLDLPSISVPAGKLKPFTFEHFVITMNGLKDEFLAPYIDYAIGIYCKLRNITISSEDKKLRRNVYTDAYETALNALYISATKMNGFDAEKGLFKSYWSKSVHDALVDILRKDKYGDFFDQTSKKTATDLEPEIHSRVGSDEFWVGDDRLEMSDEEEKRTERVRNHVSEAFEVMRKFIDTLPERDREAVYLSEMGHVLRPEIEYSGRNYAETLAAKYNTTAGNIRKIASRRLSEAVAFTNDKGYNAASMGNVMMEFQYRHIDISASDSIGISEALTQLSPFEQFKFLHYIANIKRNNMTRPVYPKMVTDVNKTEVTITPAAEIDIEHEVVLPAACIKVDYLVNCGHLLFSASFKKLLDETPFGGEYSDANVNAATEKASDLINGDLSAIGLEGLETLDVYRFLVENKAPLNNDTIKAIISASLHLPYIYEEALCPPVNGFYRLEVDWPQK